MTQLACLHSAEASLVLELRDDAPPLWRHLGARVDPAGIPALADTRTAASFSLDDDRPLTVAPGSEQGWFGRPMVEVRDGEGRARPFRPSRSSVEADPTRLTIRRIDDTLGLACTQQFAVLPGGGFVIATRYDCTGDQPLTLIDAASAMLPLAGPWQRLVSWRGRHNAELSEQDEPMPAHGWLREGRRGISGHGGPPGVYALTAGADDHAGLVLAMQLAWSGDSRIAIERDDEGYWLASATATGTRRLAPGDSIALPDVLVALSTRGRNGAMAQHHAAVRQRLCWPGGAMRPRPVHLNSWEACYFNHDEARIARLAEAGAAVGVERFVLDDGWFRGRHHDRAGLGDWTADPGNYPDGLGPLARRITALGLEFGLWVEPEMVNPDSDLYRAHPDWVLAENGADRPTARNQLVLDMRRPEVRDHLFAALDQLLTDHPIAYLKWDQNRDHAPTGGPGQTLGTYDLLSRLRAAHPGVEIEGCAGGGGRSDAGMAAYVHRFWTSDNVDALSRIGMQRGFNAFLPPEIMGAHIGASPCHATARMQPLPFRAAIACMGHLGVELDPEALTEADRAELARWIAFYKQWRDLLHAGVMHMGSAADGLVWQAQGRDDDMLLFVIRPAPALDRRPQPLRLPFPQSHAGWEVQLLEIAGNPDAHPHRQSRLTGALAEVGQRFAGSWLAHAGLPLPVLGGESVAIYRLTATSRH